MKLVEMDDVILHRLRCSNDVANQAGVVGDFDPQGILNRSDRRQCVDRRADSANALRPNPGFARIPAPQDHLNSPEHRAGTPSVRDHPAFDLGLDTEMPFNSRDWIDYYPRHRIPLRPTRFRRIDSLVGCCFRSNSVAHDIADDLCGHRRCDRSGSDPSDLVRCNIHSEPGHRWQPFVER